MPSIATMIFPKNTLFITKWPLDVYIIVNFDISNFRYCTRKVPMIHYKILFPLAYTFRSWWIFCAGTEAHECHTPKTQPDSKNILCGNCLPFPIDQKRSELRMESGKCTVCTDKNQMEEMHFGSKKLSLMKIYWESRQASALKYSDMLGRSEIALCFHVYPPLTRWVRLPFRKIILFPNYTIRTPKPGMQH